LLTTAKFLIPKSIPTPSLILLFSILISSSTNTET
jgi:hypothetical protein